MLPPIVSGYYKLEDTRLHYSVYGAGHPLLLFHGNGEDQQVFREMVGPLAKVRQVVALDTRGHGQSGRGDKPMNFTTFAEDVRDVMDGLGLPSADLLGFSDGASVAMHLALLAPKRVDRMILLGANLNTSGVRPSVQIPIVAGYQVCRALAVFSKKAKARRDIMGLMVNHPHLTPEQLGELAIPSLVMAGEKDMMRKEHTELIAQALHARLEIVPGLDHFLPAHPQKILPSILDFLSEASGGNEYA